MPNRDRRGQPLHVGDRILIPAIVTGIHPVVEYDNLVVETEEPKFPGTNRTPIVLNTKQVELFERLGDSSANVDVTQALQDSQSIKSITKDQSGDT